VSPEERRSLEIEIRALAEEYKRTTTHDESLARRVNADPLIAEAPHRRYG